MNDSFALRRRLGVIAALVFALASDATTGWCDAAESDALPHGALTGDRYRVVVSTDIGGTDPDDQQSMAHLLLYADVLDLEGLIASPYGPGRKRHIDEVIDSYEQDYANLSTHAEYPRPDALRAIAKQGATEMAPLRGWSDRSDGSRWIVDCARRDDPRPLYVLVWGGLEDLAQALHDAPDILPKLRVYWIGGPNKKWSPSAYQYLIEHHRDLWFIEANDAYRGWFTGGDQSGEWGNRAFIATHVAGHGALGDYAAALLDGQMKMGDTPSVAWLLRGDPTDPMAPSWGGRFVRAWERPYLRLERLPTEGDEVEVFGVFDLVLPLGDEAPSEPTLHLIVENQTLPGETPGDGTVRFRFCPKAAKRYEFTLRGDVPELDGRTFSIESVLPTLEHCAKSDPTLPDWWADDPAPELREGDLFGVRSVSRWREAFLRDFAERMDRCDQPAAAGG